MSEEAIKDLLGSNGENKLLWDKLGNEINGPSVDKIVSILKDAMINNPQNILTLDIIDYILDKGNKEIIDLIAKKEFLDHFLNLLKAEANSGIENEKKVIYLTKKWANKFQNNPNYPIFQENFNLLKNNGIFFPPDDYIIETYTKYIGQNQNNNNFNQNNYYYKFRLF